MYRRTLLPLAAAVCFLAGCHSHSHEESHEDEPHSVSGVTFTREMQHSIDFAVSPTEHRRLGNVIHTVAQVQQASGDETVLSTHVAGIVHLSSLSLTEGCELASGRTLCTIDASATASDNLSMRQQQALAEAKRAKAELERLEQLRLDKLSLESEVREARAAVEKAEAELKALSKGLSDGRQAVVTPRSGFLKQLMVSDGQYVETGQAIAVITTQRTLQLKAEVPMSRHADLLFICDAVVNGRSLVEDMQGRLLSYGRQVSEQNPRIPVIFEVANTGSLVPGSFVDINIITRSEADKLCVPATAILEQLGQHFVYVQQTPELFEKRQVECGVTDGRFTEIKSGLTDGEQIVSRGAMMVMMQQAAGNANPEAGHHH